MSFNQSPLSRKSNIVVQEFENEILIYDLNISKAFCLNETSAFIYQLCDGTNSIAQMRESLSKKLNTPVSENLLLLALDGLNRAGLLEKGDELNIDFGGLSRREVMKKVGLASLVALPLISSVVAPTPANAASAAASSFGVACAGPPSCSAPFGTCTSSTMICCVSGSDMFAAVSIGLLCGSCPPLASLCCSGMITDLGPAPCGGAGNGCVCNNT